jgi:hypothetical protein
MREQDEITFSQPWVQPDVVWGVMPISTVHIGPDGTALRTCDCS